MFTIETVILFCFFQDDSVVIIKDIKPASKYHFLVIPKKHIPDAKCLKKDDKTLGLLH